MVDFDKDKIRCDIIGKFDYSTQTFYMPCGLIRNPSEKLYCTIDKSNICDDYVNFHFNKMEADEKRRNGAID